MMTCLRLGYMRLEIWRKIGLSVDWCLCTALRTRSGACYCWDSIVHTYIHTNLYSAKNRENESEELALDGKGRLEEMEFQVAFKGG